MKFIPFAVVFFLTSILGFSSAEAAFVQADLPVAAGTVAETAAGTHVIIAGMGLEQGANWLYTAQTQALVYRDRAPNALIHLMAAVPAAKKAQYLALLKSWGYQNIVYTSTEMVADRVVEMLTSVPLISSLDFVGHDGAFLGFALESEQAQHRFYFKDVDRLVGKVKFSNDAFIRISGCNTGWYLAPYMARKLEVPTSGTLTGSDIELVYVDQAWHREYSTSKTAATHNQITYSQDLTCSQAGGAGCIRLIPENEAYVGQHGTYTGAVPFMKFFCPKRPDNSECFRRMALSTRYLISDNPSTETHPGSGHASVAEFAQTMADQFCARTMSTTARAACTKAVIDHVTGVAPLDPTYAPMSGKVPMIACSFSVCKFKQTADSQGRQVLVGIFTTPATTFVDELNAYMYGYQMLTEGNP